MATIHKTAPEVHHQAPHEKPQGDQRPRTGGGVVAVVILLVALFALMIWIGTMGPAPTGSDFDYWMMP